MEMSNELPKLTGSVYTTEQLKGHSGPISGEIDQILRKLLGIFDLLIFSPCPKLKYLEFRGELPGLWVDHFTSQPFNYKPVYQHQPQFQASPTVCVFSNVQGPSPSSCICNKDSPLSYTVPE